MNKFPMSEQIKSLCFLFIFLLFIILSVIAARAAEVTLAWDPNTEPELAGYNVFQAERIGDHSEQWELIATVDKNAVEYTFTVDDSKNWAWYITAFDTNGNESRASNMVEYVDKTPPLTVKNVVKKQAQ